MERELTLVTLLLDFKLLGQVLVFLPLDLRADGAIVHEVARVADLLLVQVRLLEHLILEEFVGSELEKQLETRFGFRTWQVFNTNIDERLQSLRIAVGDDLAKVSMCAESSEPELGDASRGRLDILREGGVFGIVLDRLLLTSLDLFGGWLCRTSDDRMTAVIQRLLEFKVL